MSRERWQHEVREGMRNALWKKAAARRQDMAGLQDGIDRVATLAAYNGRSLNDYDKGLLRSILSGAVRTGHQLHRSGLVDDSLCPFCGNGSIEDIEHLWWQCPAWDNIRRQYFDPAFSSYASWPICFRRCGIVPNSHEGFDEIKLDTSPFSRHYLLDVHA
eukprot:1741401-Karenia_brevis.AAC.1